MIWGYLLHLGYNMWEDRYAPEKVALQQGNRIAQPYLRCDRPLWDEVTSEFARLGGNLLLIDLAEGVRYESHPEIGCENAWSRDELKKEIARLRALGLEPIPKLNFSAAHDTWLGPYARCVSTPLYYEVCRHLIEEVIDLFERPRFFHLGMDEETFEHQRSHAYAMVRQHELWWHDLHYLVDTVERQQVQAWVWADPIWTAGKGEEYLRQMPRSVLQSNWYYGTEFNETITAVKAYHDLDRHGFEQLPTTSSYREPENFPLTVDYLGSRLDPMRLRGYMQAPWKPTQLLFREQHLRGLEATAKALGVYASQRGVCEPRSGR